MDTLECGMAEYDSYLRNGLMLQLRRFEIGKNIEQDHMRNRQLVASWAYEKGLKDNVITKHIQEIPTLCKTSGDTLCHTKTFFVINDYKKLQNIFGQLLKRNSKNNI